MKHGKKISASDVLSSVSTTILGTYEGECADANITNANGLDITRPVWETVFASDEYKQAIELGWYIGFLGHPDDPNCMDFRNACIVMTEGHIDDNGKIYGKFNLIDTPVGRVVKAFKDAGVNFGISVRGAGDIVDNSVDPDTFVFRGFDLVTFPAYPESIPTFSEIAASSDIDSQTKYKKVCAAVKSQLPNITSCEAIDVLSTQFAKQSDVRAELAARKSTLMSKSASVQESADVASQKLASMTNLYLEQVEANTKLSNQLEVLRKQMQRVSIQAKRKIASIGRITSDQIKCVDSESERLHQDVTAAEAKARKLESANTQLRQDNQKLQSANRQLNMDIKAAKSAAARLQHSLDRSEESNLKYKQTIQSNSEQTQRKDVIISQLKSKVDETVVAAQNGKQRASNLDAENRKLQKEIASCKALLSEYQKAYANMYGNALGVDVDLSYIQSTTSVQDLHRIVAATSTANISTVTLQPDPIEIIDDDVEEDSADLVTL